MLIIQRKTNFVAIQIDMFVLTSTRMLVCNAKLQSQGHFEWQNGVPNATQNPDFTIIGFFDFDVSWRKSTDNLWYSELLCKMILSNIIIASEDMDKLPALVPEFPSNPSKSAASPSPEVGVENIWLFYWCLES